MAVAVVAVAVVAEIATAIKALTGMVESRLAASHLGRRIMWQRDQVLEMKMNMLELELVQAVVVLVVLVRLGTAMTPTLERSSGTLWLRWRVAVGARLPVHPEAVL